MSQTPARAGQYPEGMRVLLAVAVAAAIVTGAYASTSADAGRRTTLRITYWETASGVVPDAIWTLRCNPPRGTLPRRAVACRKLAKGGRKLFSPVPPKAVCTEIYGGPQKARVRGVVAGRRVLTTFTRTNGCEIAHWNRLSPWLLPPGGVTR